MAKCFVVMGVVFHAWIIQSAWYCSDTMKYPKARPVLASGELTITGTRIRIAQIITMLANGYTIEELHTEWFPHVSVQTLRSAVEEAAPLLHIRYNSPGVIGIPEGWSASRIDTKLTALLMRQGPNHFHGGRDGPACAFVQSRMEYGQPSGSRPVGFSARGSS